MKSTIKENTIDDNTANMSQIKVEVLLAEPLAKNHHAKADRIVIDNNSLRNFFKAFPNPETVLDLLKAFSTWTFFCASKSEERFSVSFVYSFSCGF